MCIIIGLFLNTQVLDRSFSPLQFGSNRGGRVISFEAMLGFRGGERRFQDFDLFHIYVSNHNSIWFSWGHKIPVRLGSPSSREESRTQLITKTRELSSLARISVITNFGVSSKHGRKQDAHYIRGGGERPLEGSKTHITSRGGAYRGPYRRKLDAYYICDRGGGNHMAISWSVFSLTNPGRTTLSLKRLNKRLSDEH